MLSTFHNASRETNQLDIAARARLRSRPTKVTLQTCNEFMIVTTTVSPLASKFTAMEAKAKTNDVKAEARESCSELATLIPLLHRQLLSRNEPFGIFR